MSAVEDLQKKFLVMVRQQLPKQSFSTWFRLFKLLAISDEAVEVGVPSSFCADWLKAHFSELIQQNFRELLGRSLKLHFRVVPQLQPSEEAEQAEGSEPKQPESTLAACGLNPKYTFENFVVGACNQFAHAAAQAVAELPARAYNPLFIYGGVGLGKTHLLNAIGQRVLCKDSSRRVFYLPSEKFTNELINSIRFDRMEQFRGKFRSCDALLIDDIQFISGKERTQEEFFHTFNSLYESHRQIVVSSDRFPKEIIGLEERLRSRFEWGLIADIQAPEMETRVAILKKKAQQENIPLPNDVAFFIASSIESNIRELEGALIRLGAFSSLSGRPITLELTREVLRNVLENGQRAVTIAQIQKAVANFYRVKVPDLLSERRPKVISVPRQVAMYLARKLTDLSFPEIGREFGNKDHSTVIHAVRKVQQRMKDSPQLREEIETLRKSLRF